MGLQVDDVQMPLAAVWRRTFQFGPMDEDKFIRFLDLGTKERSKSIEADLKERDLGVSLQQESRRGSSDRADLIGNKQE